MRPALMNSRRFRDGGIDIENAAKFLGVLLLNVTQYGVVDLDPLNQLRDARRNDPDDSTTVHAPPPAVSHTGSPVLRSPVRSSLKHLLKAATCLSEGEDSRRRSQLFR